MKTSQYKGGRHAFGVWLESQLKKRKWTLTQLAVASRLPWSTIHKLARYDRGPRRATQIIIEQTLKERYPG